MTTESIYTRKKKAPLWWYNKSSDLHASAGVLWLSMDAKQSRQIVQQLNLGEGFDMCAVWPVYMMLCGMSLELIYKAMSVSRGNDVEITHDLVKLANLSGVNLDNQTKGILEILTESIIWEGRYPVPKKQESIEKLYHLSLSHVVEKSYAGKFKVQKYNHALDWESYNRIWKDATELFFKNNS